MTSNLARSKSTVEDARQSAQETGKKVSERGFSYSRISKYFKTKGIEEYADLKRLTYDMVMDYLHNSRVASEKKTYDKLARLDTLELGGLVQNAQNEQEFLQGLSVSAETRGMNPSQKLRILGLYRHYKDIENSIRRVYMARESVNQMTRRSLKAEKANYDVTEFGREKLKNAADAVREAAGNLSGWGKVAAGLFLVWGGYTLYEKSKEKKEAGDKPSGFFGRNLGRLFKGIKWLIIPGALYFTAANLGVKAFTKKSIIQRINEWMKGAKRKEAFKKDSKEMKAMRKIMTHEQLTEIMTLTSFVGNMPFVDVLTAYRQHRLPSGVLNNEMDYQAFKKRMDEVDKVFKRGSMGGLDYLEKHHSKENPGWIFAEILGAGIYERVANPMGKDEGRERNDRNRQILVTAANPLTINSLPASTALRRQGLHQMIRANFGLTHPTHVNAALVLINKYIQKNNIRITHASLAQFLAKSPELNGTAVLPGSGGSMDNAKFRQIILKEMKRVYATGRPRLTLAGRTGDLHNAMLRNSIRSLKAVTGSVTALPKFERGMNSLFVAPLALAATGDTEAKLYMTKIHGQFPVDWQKAFGPISAVTAPSAGGSPLQVAIQYLQNMVNYFKHDVGARNWISQGVMPLPREIEESVLAGLRAKFGQFQISMSPNSPSTVEVRDPRLNSIVFRVNATGSNKWVLPNLRDKMTSKSLEECIRLMTWAMDVAHVYKAYGTQNEKRAFRVKDGTTVQFVRKGWIVSRWSLWYNNIDTSKVDSIDIKKPYLAKLLLAYWLDYKYNK